MKSSKTIEVVSVSDEPQWRDIAITKLQDSWSEVPPHLYEESVDESLEEESALPRWYLLVVGGEPVGCVGLIEQELIDITKYSPWLVALYVDEEHRGLGHSRHLIERLKSDAQKGGYSHLYLVTELDNYYEKFGFTHIDNGTDPEGYELKVYSVELSSK